MQRVALTAATSGGPQAAAGHFGRRAALERRAGGRRSRLAVGVRFNPSGQYVAASGRAASTGLPLSVNDQLAALDSDTRGIWISDRTGKVLVRIPARGAGYDLDGAGRSRVRRVRAPLCAATRAGARVRADGKLLATFTPDPANGFRSGTALALDPAGRLYIYDEAQGRVLVYQ